MSRMSIRLLGPPQIECGSQLIKVDTRKAIALLAYIALTEKRHRRDSLVNLLWLGYSQDRGRTNLCRTLYALRKSLEGDWLDIDREEIGLDWDGLCPPEQSLEMCRMVDRAELTVISNADHFTIAGQFDLVAMFFLNFMKRQGYPAAWFPGLVSAP